jgi:hypothetical protein
LQNRNDIRTKALIATLSLGIISDASDSQAFEQIISGSSPVAGHLSHTTHAWSDAHGAMFETAVTSPEFATSSLHC